METISRRNFVKFSAASAAGIMLSPTLGFSSAPARLFKISLNPFAVGVNLGQEELIDKALKYGFEAILPIPAQLAEMQTGQRSEFLAKMNARSEERRVGKELCRWVGLGTRRVTSQYVRGRKGCGE